MTDRDDSIDEPLRRATACAASARATRSSRVALVAPAAGAVRGPVDPPRRRADGPGDRPDARCWPSASRRAGSRDRLPLADGGRRARPPGCRRTTTSATRGGFDARGGARRRGRRPAGDRRRVRPRRRSAASRRPRRPLRTLLVTGDSLSTPLDTELARRLSPTRRQGDPRPAPRHRHLEERASWTGASCRRAGPSTDPDAVVMFIGANEGFPMPRPGRRDVECCGPEWAAVYANRVRRDDGHLPARRRRARLLAHAADAARPRPRRDPPRRSTRRSTSPPQPWRAQVRVIDTAPIFTPDGLPRRDGRRRRADDRARGGRHPPQRGRRAPAGRHGLRAIARDRTYWTSTLTTSGAPLFSHMPRPIRLTALTLVLPPPWRAHPRLPRPLPRRTRHARASSGLSRVRVLHLADCQASDLRFGGRLARAYYRCRTQSGPAGRCHRSRVLHYRCREVARVKISTELNGRVRCTRGGKRVVHTYQQNL